MSLAAALAVAGAVAPVVIADINEATLRTFTDELTADGHRILGVRCDASDEDSVARSKLIQSWTRLSALFGWSQPHKRFGVACHKGGFLSARPWWQ